MKKSLLIVISLLLIAALTVGCSMTGPTAQPSEQPASEAPAATPDATPEASTAPAEETPATKSQAPAAAGGDDITGLNAPDMPEGTFKVGFAMADLNNPVWAELCQVAQEYGKQKGIELTVVDCQNDSGKQITQIENFIQSGMDGIIFCAADINAMGPVVQQAKDKGIAVMSYGLVSENSDTEFICNNYSIGENIGKQAAQWIIDNLDGKAKVAILDQPEQPEIMQRSKGIRDTLAKMVPESEIVASASAVTASNGMKHTETFLQANPDLKVIACIGDGGAVGANEAVIAAGKDAPDFGIFSADGTTEVLEKIKAGQPTRMSLSLGGGNYHGHQVIDMISLVLNDLPFEKSYYTPEIPVTIDNVDEYLK